MARGVSSPAPNPLPKVSFVKVIDEVTQQAPGVHDHVARSYGYNDFSEFTRPEHYIRYIEPLETELALQVEYDMDEQDQDWLDVVNIERKAQQLDKVSYETFEIIMDRLEKEWFDLTKNIPKYDMALPSEDSTCAVCDDSEGENTNAIVFCDGCNLAVHQDCYGVPYIPEGQWLCRKCTVSPENPVSCILCPNEGGAFKQTNSGDWLHLLCAIWVPETGVANDIFMEPITGVDKISKQRWKLRCSVCEIRHGACIQCSKASCFTAFHATCARKEKLLMPMKASQGSEAPALACYCERHLPREQQEARTAAQQADHSDDSDADPAHPSSKSNKTARAYAKTYKPGPPLVPRIIVNRILLYISRLQLRHKPEFVYLVCRYWSLKREARRGAPLLKRLHLEPWTALSGSKQQTDEEKIIKLDHMKRLRLDLDRLRAIADTVQRREHTKQKQADAIQSVLLHFFFPHEAFFRLAFQKITMHDRQDYFKTPVNRAEVPDYYDIVKKPMCWDTIDEKLDQHEYLDLTEFKNDIDLVLNNAMVYNQANTPFYRTALRIQVHAQATLAELDRLVQQPTPMEAQRQPLSPDPPHSSDSAAMIDEKPELEVDSGSSLTLPEALHPAIGDLEPPLHLLDLLISEPSIRNDTNIIVTSNPIQSLLNFELPLIRPPAPPPPSRSKPQQRKKVNRKVTLERKKLARQMALDSSPGFRAPRTRSAMAAAAAFEAEITQTPGPSTSTLEMQSGSTSPEKPRKQRRSYVPPPDLPLTVDEVDSKKSFTMFERGWILPPDQKRGGRVAVERQPPLPPRKRTKTAHEKSDLLNAISPPANDESHATTDEAEAHVDYPDLEPTVAAEPLGLSGHSDYALQNVHIPATLETSSDAPSLSSAQESSSQHARTPAPGPANIWASPHALAEPIASPEPVVLMPDQPGCYAEPDIAPLATRPPQSQVPPFVGETVLGRPIPEQPTYQHKGVPGAMEVERPAEVIPMEVDVPVAGIAVPQEKTLVAEAEEPEEEHRDPPRIIYIDTLDTPAIRREKSQRKRAERDAVRAHAAAEATFASNSMPVAGPPRVREVVTDADSDLTDLSDSEDGSGHAVDPPPIRQRLSAPPEPGAIILKEGERLEGGTLVWAKIDSYPWWPAVVFEEDDPEVPKSVLASAPEADDQSLVRFYEKNHIKNWAWVKLRNMRYLGENDALDAEMLAPTSKYQRWRNANRRTECRNAYQDALAEMEAEEQPLAQTDSTVVGR